ncbi:MAG: hypothetical protein P1U70_23875 [Saprospiraceae bacterium]|jgi:hypothetical protein|nr:hypothetical protein [Saprospiraceae bacterium]
MAKQKKDKNQQQKAVRKEATLSLKEKRALKKTKKAEKKRAE